MKPLSQMNNVEKGKLLHQLIPEQITAFVAFMETTAKEINANPEKVKDNWGSRQPLTAELWIKLAKDIEIRIPKNGTNLSKKSNWFAAQMFDGYTALFTIQCLQNYMAICPNSRFNKAIELLFDI